jgi:hypothetical protein
MSNALLQYNRVAMEALRVLSNSLGYAPYVNTAYGDEYKKFKNGSQITVPRPPRYVTRRGRVMQVQPIVQEPVTVTIQDEIGVDIELTQDDMALITGNKFEAWKQKLIDPAVSEMASSFDWELGKAARLGFFNYVGTAGTDPSTLPALMLATRRLNEESAPQTARTGVFGPGAHSVLVGGLSGNFVTRVITEAELRANLNFPIAGMERIVMSQSAPSHTVGTFAGSFVVEGAGQSGRTLHVSGGVSGDTLNAGDVFTIPGVNAVNRQAQRSSTGQLRNFAVQEDVTFDAAGEADIAIYPPITPPVSSSTPSQFQTVDSFPADQAAIVVLTGATGATHQEGTVFHKDAMGLITIPLVKPPDSFYCEELRLDGISMRVWIASDITDGSVKLRLDILPAFPVFYPELGVRVAAA